jgi:hypothetical protein
MKKSFTPNSKQWQMGQPLQANACGANALALQIKQ